MKTTLNAIRKHEPCESSWKKFLQSLGKTEADDTEVTIRYILDLLGVEDAIWSLRAVEGHDKEMRLFACDCAENVLHIFEEKHPNDDRPRKAVEVSRRYAEGEATIDELNDARAAAEWVVAKAAAKAYDWYAANASAWATASAAAMAAANASAWVVAWAASRATAEDAEGVVARRTEREKQREYLLKYI